MRKIVLVFGLISGLVGALLMDSSVYFADRIGFGHSLLVGYTIIVASMLLVYFGIRSYRDNVLGGGISFGRAFATGMGIVVISSVIYAIAWDIVYYNFMPDFMDKYSAYVVAKAQAAGASQAAVQAQLQQMQHLRALYANPLTNAAMTFLEPFPVGLLVALLSAVLLRRKGPLPQPPTTPPVV